MGPKIKPSGKAGGKGVKKVQEEDNSTKELLTHFKKNCKELETPIYKPLELKLTELLDETLHLNEILINDTILPAGIKAITKSLKSTK